MHKQKIGLEILADGNLFEICACGCEQITNVRKDTPVDERNHYVDGIGQLLPECYANIYGISRRDEAHNRIWLEDS